MNITNWLIWTDCLFTNYRNCNMMCPGNKKVRCGGSWSMNIYRGSGKPCKYSRVNKSFFKRLKNTLCNTQLTGSRPRRIRCSLGCYKDDGKRILPKAFINIAKNTPRACAKHCRREGYSLSGVQYTRQCFCGKRLASRAFLIDPSRCNHKCPGNRSKNCGGTWAMNVTRTRTGENAKCNNYL